ncbi:MAG: hypothetical protein LW650_13865 [Planctomycetaceae bacterium]|jgi:hypothetical protein|nr:hypothetical protein [Phycisphaerales bacterium]MCE2654487.1 hypothetical protein [Planctomycetaceae bacterium]
MDIQTHPGDRSSSVQHAEHQQPDRLLTPPSVDMVLLDTQGEPAGRVTLTNVDLGEDGVRVISPMSIDRGTRTLLITPGRGSFIPSLVYAEVATSAPQPDGRFYVVMRYTPIPVGMLSHNWLSLVLHKAAA